MNPDEIQINPIYIVPAVADDTGKLTADDKSQTRRLVSVDQPDGEVHIVTEVIPEGAPKALRCDHHGRAHRDPSV
ncbi:hypothetical protein [Bradyrhizobium elkanii]|uniref:hypothetical protein n=1 Tax=Bradyrhizobium elkanii TaxID=29448 RepID=UPI0035155B40